MAVLTRKRSDKTGERRPRRWPFARRAGPESALDLSQYESLPGGLGGEPEQSLGEWLRSARHDRGFTLDELAEITRVKRSYLEAIEDMRLDVLPSRPFTIGYIRAYAAALGLQPDTAVERFKIEEPVLDEPLRNPVGVLEEKDPRVATFVAGAIVIIAAIMAWNIAQRAMLAAAPAPPKAPDDRAWKVLAGAKPAPIVLGKPLPAPLESTTPPPYETPGLEAALAGKTLPARLGGASVKNAEDPMAALAVLPQTFTPAGAVYGASPQAGSFITVQAVKPGLLIARGADGSVYFARQLSKGEAYRVPQVGGLTLDVSDPHDFQVFVSGQSKGFLPAQQVLAAKLVAPPAAPAASPAAAP